MNRKSPARNALNLFFYFCMIVVAFTLICAAVFTVYKLCSRLVSGHGSVSFDPVLFVRGIFIFAPIVLIASGSFMLFYLMRHSSSSWLPLIVYIILYGTSWFILIPMDLTMEKKYSEKHTLLEEYNSKRNIVLSSGYFRDLYQHKDGNQQGEKSVWYYSSVEKNNVATGLAIDFGTASGKGVGSLYTFSDASLDLSQNEFSDPLIEKNVKMNSVVAYTVNFLRLTSIILRKAFFAGTLAWYAYLTMALALLAVAGVRHISKWRLVNLVAISFFSIAIIVINNLIYTDSIMNPVTNFMNNLLSGVPIKTANPFAVLFNLLTFLVLTIAGIIRDIHHRIEVAEEEIIEDL